MQALFHSWCTRTMRSLSSQNFILKYLTESILSSPNGGLFKYYGTIEKHATNARANPFIVYSIRWLFLFKKKGFREMGIFLKFPNYDFWLMW